MRPLQLVLFDQDGVGGKARMELYLVQAVVIGRVGDREEQAVAAPEQGQRMVRRSSFSSTRSVGACSRSMVSRSSSGTPNSCAAATAICCAEASPSATR